MSLFRKKRAKKILDKIEREGRLEEFRFLIFGTRNNASVQSGRAGNTEEEYTPNQHIMRYFPENPNSIKKTYQ